MVLCVFWYYFCNSVNWKLFQANFNKNKVKDLFPWKKKKTLAFKWYCVGLNYIYAILYFHKITITLKLHYITGRIFFENYVLKGWKSYWWDDLVVENTVLDTRISCQIETCQSTSKRFGILSSCFLLISSFTRACMLIQILTCVCTYIHWHINKLWGDKRWDCKSPRLQMTAMKECFQTQQGHGPDELTGTVTVCTNLNKNEQP